MSMLKVIYWSGTGNTKAMAQAVVNGAKKAGAEVELVDVSQHRRCTGFSRSTHSRLAVLPWVRRFLRKMRWNPS
ncbi:hypothetical protein MASR2M48_06830 [Spirochaetota bacterium]